MPHLGKLSAEKGADTDQRVLEAYQMQCIAEAQEGENIRVQFATATLWTSFFFNHIYIFTL